MIHRKCQPLPRLWIVYRIWLGLGFIFFGAFQFNPAFAQLSDESIQNRCWLQPQCEEQFRGIWGRITSDRYKATGATADDDWSEKNCRPLGPDNDPTARCFTGNPDIPLQIGIPGVSTRFCSVYTLGETPTDCTTDAQCQGQGKGKCRPGIVGGFPGYLKYFYNFFVWALAVFAVTLISWGGFKRIMAAGSTERIKDANDTIFKAIIGLVLALLSYTLLNLLNPKLVANTVPLIEKVRPEFFGFCPAYSEASMAYESGYKEFVCQGGTNPNTTCQKNENCPGGECVAGETKSVQSGLPYSPVGDTCGKKLVLNGRECVATECSGKQGCFQIQGKDPAEYKCTDYMVQGKLVGVEVNDLDLMLVCNNNTTTAFNCSISSPNGTNQNVIDVEGKGSYALTGCWGNDGGGNFVQLSPTYCSGAGGFKGIALLADIDAPGTCANNPPFFRGLGCDDWYAIDASSCNSPSTKAIKGVPTPIQNDPKALWPWIYDWRLIWANVPASSLLQPFDQNGVPTPIQCDLAFSRQEFPDRNDEP